MKSRTDVDPKVSTQTAFVATYNIRKFRLVLTKASRYAKFDAIKSIFSAKFDLQRKVELQQTYSIHIFNQGLLKSVQHTKFEENPTKNVKFNQTYHNSTFSCKKVDTNTTVFC